MVHFAGNPVEENNVTDTIWAVDFAGSSEPKYIVLVQFLRAAIRSARLAPGDRLPPVRDLAWRLGITPGTVARAYRLATDEGLLQTQVGRGSFVAAGRSPASPADEPLMQAAGDDLLDFRACRVVDLGQGAAIATALGRIGRGGAYVDYPDEQSDRAARIAVRDWIGQARAGRLAEDDIVLSFGAQNGVVTALQACLSGPAPVVLAEELAYPGVRHAARLVRATLIGVELDQAGLRPDRMEAALRAHGGQALITSAEAHSATTQRTPPERRQELVDIARQYQVQIIEDDCHTIARPQTPAYRALCPELGWYVGSLSKVFSPALRFGFVACPSGMARAARRVAQSSCYGLPRPLTDLAADLLASGAVEEARTKIVASVEERVREAVNVLGRWEIAWRSDVPFIWLRLPAGWRCSTFASACEAGGLRVKPADEYALPNGSAPQAVRVAINPGMPSDRFAAGLATLNDLLAHPPLGEDF